jgi:hypothetical protein
VFLILFYISFVGPCGAGKSSIIRALTPEACPKPTVSNVLQAVPTSGDVHVFDTPFYLPVKHSTQKFDINNNSPGSLHR